MSLNMSSSCLRNLQINVIYCYSIMRFCENKFFFCNQTQSGADAVVCISPIPRYSQHQPRRFAVCFSQIP